MFLLRAPMLTAVYVAVQYLENRYFKEKVLISVSSEIDSTKESFSPLSETSSEISSLDGSEQPNLLDSIGIEAGSLFINYSTNECLIYTGIIILAGVVFFYVYPYIINKLTAVDSNEGFPGNNPTGSNTNDGFIGIDPTAVNTNKGSLIITDPSWLELVRSFQETLF